MIYHSRFHVDWVPLNPLAYVMVCGQCYPTHMNHKDNYIQLFQIRNVHRKIKHQIYLPNISTGLSETTDFVLAVYDMQPSKMYTTNIKVFWTIIWVICAFCMLGVSYHCRFTLLLKIYWLQITFLLPQQLPKISLLKHQKAAVESDFKTQSHMDGFHLLASKWKHVTVRPAHRLTLLQKITNTHTDTDLQTYTMQSTYL